MSHALSSICATNTLERLIVFVCDKFNIYVRIYLRKDLKFVNHMTLTNQMRRLMSAIYMHIGVMFVKHVDNWVCVRCECVHVDLCV